MEEKQTNFILYIMGVVGLIVLLLGVFGFYPFKYGIVGAIIIWVIAGGYRQYFGVRSVR